MWITTSSLIFICTRQLLWFHHCSLMMWKFIILSVLYLFVVVHFNFRAKLSRFLRLWLITTFTSFALRFVELKVFFSVSSSSSLSSPTELNSFVSLENYNLIINYEDVSVPHHRNRIFHHSPHHDASWTRRGDALTPNDSRFFIFCLHLLHFCSFTQLCLYLS